MRKPHKKDFEVLKPRCQGCRAKKKEAELLEITWQRLGYLEHRYNHIAVALSLVFELNGQSVCEGCLDAAASLKEAAGGNFLEPHNSPMLTS